MLNLAKVDNQTDQNVSSVTKQAKIAAEKEPIGKNLMESEIVADLTESKLNFVNKKAIRPFDSIMRQSTLMQPTINNEY